MYIFIIPLNNCRKDYVKKELAIGKVWEKNWGFLPSQYQEVNTTVVIEGLQYIGGWRVTNFGIG